ncbi:hypothetical protein SMC26_14935 [Actinomadura fulvescens]|uniref:Uncharacterized protein n=1 Tax=Actinomadura fulvescens TaxID=46160 RepID=A0ABP6D341_9ACTN
MVPENPVGQARIRSAIAVTGPRQTAYTTLILEHLVIAWELSAISRQGLYASATSEMRAAVGAIALGVAIGGAAAGFLLRTRGHTHNDRKV